MPKMDDLNKPTDAKTDAGDPVSANHDVSGQERTKGRLKGEEAKAKESGTDLLTLRIPDTGVEQQVTPERWAKEGQTLRQLGYERVSAK